MSHFTIGLQGLTFEDIVIILNEKKSIQLSEDAKNRVVKCRSYLDNKLKNNEAPIYGINTGFGSLCNTKIADDQLEQLQANLVMSHACGTGEKAPLEIVKLMLLLKVQGLCYGHSGVQPETIERLIYFFNNDILPVVYTQGSLGASGDLAPLAHLCLPMLNLGKVVYKGKETDAAEINKLLNLPAIRLQSKEGLALLNGTQFMSAYATFCLLKALRMSTAADAISAMSLEAFDGRIDPFNILLHTIRPHKGQLETAKFFLAKLAGSELTKQHKEAVQDPYSFRCVPQVHGASKDVFAYVKNVVLTEINSVTDNPTIFPDEDLILSGGNFHGQPLAIALDMLALALHELGSISERRTYQLISGTRKLPPFLVKNPGLNSGFMIPQYTAASIVSQSKQLCTPASADSIVSSNGQEDHVSMGANAASKCLRVLENTQQVLGIELLNAAQALEFRRPLKSSIYIEELHIAFRKQIPFIESDIFLSPLLLKASEFVVEYGF